MTRIFLSAGIALLAAGVFAWVYRTRPSTHVFTDQLITPKLTRGPSSVSQRIPADQDNFPPYQPSQLIHDAPQSTEAASSGRVPSAEDRWVGYSAITKTIAGNTYYLLVADTPEKQRNGLMHVTDLGEFDGMIFLFPQQSPRTFWNMNTLMPLDVIWMNGDTIVGRSRLPAVTDTKKVVTVSSPQPVDTVVELPARPL